MFTGRVEACSVYQRNNKLLVHSDLWKHAYREAPRAKGPKNMETLSLAKVHVNTQFLALVQCIDVMNSTNKTYGTFSISQAITWIILSSSSSSSSTGNL
jgi:hypothetical protein